MTPDELAAIRDRSIHGVGVDLGQALRDVRALVVEVDRIHSAVEELPVKPNGYWVEELSETVSRAAVLRIVDGGQP